MYGLILICSLLPGQADPSDAADELRGQVRSLVRQLDHDDLKQREEAEASLKELGVPILDFLPEINDRTPGEVEWLKNTEGGGRKGYQCGCIANTLSQCNLMWAMASLTVCLS